MSKRCLSFASSPQTYQEPPPAPSASEGTRSFSVAAIFTSAMNYNIWPPFSWPSPPWSTSWPLLQHSSSPLSPIQRLVARQSQSVESPLDPASSPCLRSPVPCSKRRKDGDAISVFALAHRWRSVLAVGATGTVIQHVRTNLVLSNEPIDDLQVRTTTGNQVTSAFARRSPSSSTLSHFNS